MLNTCFGAAYSAGLVAIGVLMYMYHKFLMVLHQDNVGLFFPIVLHECCRPIIYLRAWSCMFIHFILFPSPQLCTTLYSNIGLPISTENRRPNWLPLILFKCSPLAFCRGLGQPFYFSSQRAPHLDLGTGQVENQQGGWTKLTYGNKQLDSAIKAPSRDWHAEIFSLWSGLGLDGGEIVGYLLDGFRMIFFCGICGVWSRL